MIVRSFSPHSVTFTCCALLCHSDPPTPSIQNIFPQHPCCVFLMIHAIKSRPQFPLERLKNLVARAVQHRDHLLSCFKSLCLSGEFSTPTIYYTSKPEEYRRIYHHQRLAESSNFYVFPSISVVVLQQHLCIQIYPFSRC